MPPTPAAITPEQVNAATTALVDATKQAAVQGATQIATNQNELAPGLNTGQNIPGGFNYARNIAPVIDPLTTSLVSGAQQAIYKQALKDAQFSASEQYELAQMGLRARERAYREEQARRNRDRRIRAEREAAAAAASALAAQKTANSQMLAVQNNNQPAVVARPSSQLRVVQAQPGKITSVGVANPGKISSVGVANPGKITSVGVANPGRITTSKPGNKVSF